MQKSFTYQIDGKEYQVLVIYKRKKNISFRYKDGQFVVTSPNFVTISRIVEGLDKYGKRLLDRYNQKRELDNDKRLYLFGEELSFNPDGGIISYHQMNIEYTSREELIDKLIKIYTQYMVDRTRYYENIMGVTPPYKIKIKAMKSRFGSNSKQTHTIYYASHLFGYSFDILDSLIVHELAHHFVFDHSHNFYTVVYKYCPNYKKDNIKLKKRIYR